MKKRVSSPAVAFALLAVTFLLISFRLHRDIRRPLLLGLFYRVGEQLSLAVRD